MGRPKITVVGAGNVGGTVAQRLAEKNAYDVVLVDIVPESRKGRHWISRRQGLSVATARVSSARTGMRRRQGLHCRHYIGHAQEAGDEPG